MRLRPGDAVRDRRRGRVGVVTGRDDAHDGVRLRPLTSGPQWTAEAADLEPVSHRERLRACLAEVNARSRRSI
ncbi:hypothetical protein CP980_08190 [Streptomyces vinaceus]|uniref:Uncharacterized protein n=1 Tax=Streptomyces vinaceus TaxID=1960 RepID=A0A5J6J5S3_STRVI|nr:hypothetical protein [Streptomyces vinaceus]QEV45041.1 hypothetical protein CP980_08190 [Streptomyces vinaceus]